MMELEGQEAKYGNLTNQDAGPLLMPTYYQTEALPFTFFACTNLNIWNGIIVI